MSNTQLIRLSNDLILKPFDCGDSDLTDFFLSDAKRYNNELLAVTYIIENDKETIAFFSLLNDKITITDAESKSQWRKLFRDKMPSGKRFSSYPAMKIGRCCRYITVDAYRQSLEFYKKNDFLFLTNSDKDSDTRLMYFDLIKLK